MQNFCTKLQINLCHINKWLVFWLNCVLQNNSLTNWLRPMRGGREQQQQQQECTTLPTCWASELCAVCMRFVRDMRILMVVARCALRQMALNFAAQIELELSHICDISTTALHLMPNLHGLYAAPPFCYANEMLCKWEKALSLDLTSFLSFFWQRRTWRCREWLITVKELEEWLQIMSTICMQIAAKVCLTLVYCPALHKEVSANKAAKATQLGDDGARVAAVAGSQSANMWPNASQPTPTHYSNSRPDAELQFNSQKGCCAALLTAA